MVLERKQPEKTIAWLLILTLLPPIGLILYIFLGRNWKRNKLNDRINPKINDLISPILDEYPEKQYVPLMELLAFNSDSPIFVNNDIKIYKDGVEKFKDLKEVESVFEHDLSVLLESNVKVSLFELDNEEFSTRAVKGTCLEELDCCKDLSFKGYEYSPSLLTFDKEEKTIKKTYYTNLFRSLCPVTSQPDHAVVRIDYEGKKPDLKGLLSYLVSLRNHQGFHEQCVELIYSDLMYYLKPSKLTVSAYFTRRGGIDINPVRSSAKLNCSESVRTIRQ